MRNIFRKPVVAIVSSFLLFGASTAFADQECPVNYYGAMSMDEEFGIGAEAITHCLKKRKHAKVVVSVDHTHPANKNGVTQTDKATFLSNIDKMIRNYEVVHGMKIGEDVDVVVVFTSSGALLATTQHPAWTREEQGVSVQTNPFRDLVELGLEKGFKFYVCQTASRALGINMGNKIPGINFVPGGQLAVADFQMEGYALINP